MGIPWQPPGVSTTFVCILGNTKLLIVIQVNYASENNYDPLNTKQDSIICFLWPEESE